MANTRIKDISTAATTLNSDDFIAVDGSTAGTRKMAKADLITEVSSGVSGTYLEESNNLSDVASKDTSKLNLEVPDVGSAANEVSLNGMLGDMAFQSSDSVSMANAEVETLEVTDKVDGTLDVEQSSGTLTTPSSVTTLRVNNSGTASNNAAVTVTSGTSGSSFVLLGDNENDDIGYIKYSNQTNALVFATAATDRWTIDSSGSLVASSNGTGSRAASHPIVFYGTNSGSVQVDQGSIGTEAGTANSNAGELVFKASNSSGALTERFRVNEDGNIQMASGLGIDFGSTTSGTGNTVTSGLLDDYEEGTATPTDASGGGLTLSGEAMNYVKIGSQVTAWVKVIYPTNSDTNSSAIGGFPFAFGASDIDRVGGSISYTTLNSALTVLADNPSSLVRFRKLDGGTYTNAELSGKQVWFSVTYDVS